MSAGEPAEPITPPTGFPRILPHLIYEDVASAIIWLTNAFGFQERTSARHTSPDGTIGRTQMEVADSLITLGQPSIHGDSPRKGVSSMLYVYVDNVDEHYRQAMAAGATIVIELDDRLGATASTKPPTPKVTGGRSRDISVTWSRLNTMRNATMSGATVFRRRPLVR